jgi:hypothetical protein
MRIQRLLRLVAHEAVAAPGSQPAGQLGDVLAVVGVVGKHHVAPEVLLVADPDAPGEPVDLGAGVVVVVLPVHLPPGPGQQLGDGVAEGGLAAVADVERPGRVGGDELDVHRLAGAVLRAAVVSVPLQDVGERAGHGALGQPEVDEPGTRHLDRVDAECAGVDPLGDLLGDLPRSASQDAGEGHGHVGGPVAVVGIAGTFQNDFARVLDTHLGEDPDDLAL